MAGMVGLLFVLYFRIPRRVWVSMIIFLTLVGCFYWNKIDKPGFERITIWRTILRDSIRHPVTGWGMDSFANMTPQKNFRYKQWSGDFKNYTDKDGRTFENIKYIAWWDNPHNLYISLMFEFGFVGLFLFAAYIRQNVLRFKFAIKSPEVIGLGGFILVFLLVSTGHFPMWLARLAPSIIAAFALFEISTA